MNYKENRLTPLELEKMGIRLTNLLREAGMQKNELARLLSVKPCAVTQYCKGYRQPSDEMIEQIAKILNTNPSYILYGANTGMLSNLSAVRGISLRQTIKNSNSFWNDLTVPEKLFIFFKMFDIIHHFRLTKTCGMSMEDLHSLCPDKYNLISDLEKKKHF